MIDKNKLPRHIAIIMDGNGRWAKEKGLPRTAGHRQGIKRVDEIVEACARLGIEYLTLFAFSTENWSRPKKEIDMLMRALYNFLGHQIKKLEKNNVRLRVIGRDEPIPKYVQAKLRYAQDRTKDNNGLTVVLALNYGARQEIVDAARSCALDVCKHKINPDSIDAKTFARYLYTDGIIDPDLLIRTSGEHRLSNFLLWQLSYSELYFPSKNWPDFTKDDLEKAIEFYQSRERRFGGINASKEDN